MQAKCVCLCVHLDSLEDKTRKCEQPLSGGTGERCEPFSGRCFPVLSFSCFGKHKCFTFHC